MKRLVTFFLVLILVICGIMIIATAVLQFVNLDHYRDRIASLATEAIGRRVNIDGHIDIDLLPHPEVILNDISLANAEWGSEPTMARIKHIDASIGFFSLFSDTIIVRRLNLHDVNVLLEKNEQNLGNWVMGTTEPSVETEPKNSDPDTDDTVHLPVMVDSAEFNNVTLTMRTNEGAGQVYHLSSFSLKPDEYGNLILTSSGELLGNAMALTGTITSKESMSALEAVNVDIQASFGDANLTGDISTRQLATLADLKGNVSIAVKDIQRVLKKAGIEAPFTGPLTAYAAVSRDGAAYKTTLEAEVEGITVNMDGVYTDKEVDLDATLAPLRRVGELFGLQGVNAEALTLKARVNHSDAEKFEIDAFQAGIGKNRLTAQGRVNTDGDATFSLNLSSPDLNSLLDTLPRIDLEAKATVHHSAEKIAVSGLAVAFDKSDIAGDIAMRKGDKPQISAHLTSKLLDLRPFSDDSQTDGGADQATSPGTAAKRPGKTGTTENQYVFKATPLQLAPLQRAEADATIAIDHFLYDFLELKKVGIEAAVHGGQVDAKFKCDAAFEGHAAGKIELKPQGTQAAIDTLVSVSDYRAKILQAEGVSQTEVPPINVSMELQSAGSSPRELAAAANGRFLLTQGPGKIKNTALGTVSGDILSQLFSSLNPFAESEEFSNWECTVLKINLADGLADIVSMLAQGEKVMILGGGDIDLKTERLNVEFNTKPRKGVGISADMFVTPFVKVKGTLANPSVGLNKKGTLLTGGAAFATGGLSLLLKGIFDRATAEGDHCEKALEMAGQHTHYDF